MTSLAKMFEPSKNRLISNAKRMTENAQDPEFKAIWEKIYIHLLKQYNKLKRELIAAFKKAKKQQYTLSNSKIKKIPVKDRKVARRKLKQELQARLQELKKRLPSASKLTRAGIEKLIAAAKLLKWSVVWLTLFKN